MWNVCVTVDAKKKQFLFKNGIPATILQKH